jgi:hypothetical protein
MQSQSLNTIKIIFIIITENIKPFIDLSKELIEKINNIYFFDVEQNKKIFNNDSIDVTKCDISNNNIFVEDNDVNYDDLRKKIYEEYRILLGEYEKIKDRSDYNSLINQLENIAKISILIKKFINTFDDYIGCLYKLYNLCICINEIREKFDDFIQKISEEELNKFSKDKPHHLKINNYITDILNNIINSIIKITEHNSQKVTLYNQPKHFINY